MRVRLGDEYRIVLFGSQTRGDAQETSDIDIGIFGENEVPWSTYLAIRRDVASIRTLRKIDVVDLCSVSDSFREQALADGKDIACV
jgi:predicted nucleotidyltransferase